MKEVISIDLGSNTFRVALCYLNKDTMVVKNSFERIVGSARNISETKMIGNEAKSAIKSAIAELVDKFDTQNIDCFCVATQAFRYAKNADCFFNEILQEYNIKFNIISPVLEAKLSYLGIKNAMQKLDFKDEFSFVDLGGASTEVGNGKKFHSFEVGIITFYEQNIKIDSMKTNAKLATSKIRDFLIELKPKTIALTSGIPTTIAALRLGKSWQTYNSQDINGYELLIDDFDILRDEILSMSNDKVDTLLGKGRKMPVIAGLFLLEEILKDIQAKMVVIDDGLREGVAIAALNNKFYNILNLKENV